MNTDQIVDAIGKTFRTFGGGSADKYNPISVGLKDTPLSFAAAVDVKEVVEFIRPLMRPDMLNPTLRKGSIVFLHPERCLNQAFAGCLMIVEEPTSWGAKGYVPSVGQTRNCTSQVAYYRAQHEEMCVTLGEIPPMFMRE